MRKPLYTGMATKKKTMEKTFWMTVRIRPR
jgi:hypothetical protein